MLISMKYFLLLIALLHHSVSIDEDVDESSSETSEEDCVDDTYVSDENGTSEYHAIVNTSVKLLFLTPSNETIELNSTNLDLLNTTLPTKFLIQGLGTHDENGWIDQMAFVYHTHGNYNIIEVDWETVSLEETDYLVSVVDTVGNVVGNFIMQITNTDVEVLRSVHLIGSSVGAQVGGAAGEAVGKQGQKVGRITGLDPTVPADLEILDEDDADFVDVIHTSVVYGERGIGTVNFYVEDGDGHPICSDNSTDGVNNTCDDFLASDLYIKSIEEGGRFEGISCYNASWDPVKVLCDKANSAVMGEYVSRNVSGNYAVPRSGTLGLYINGNYILSFSFALILWYLCV